MENLPGKSELNWKTIFIPTSRTVIMDRNIQKSFIGTSQQTDGKCD
jgi:hypothetical protein